MHGGAEWDAAALALVGEGLLAALVLRLGLAARTRAPALAPALFAAAALSLVGTVLRVNRYASAGGSSIVEVTLNGGAQALGWGLLAWALLRWPGPRPSGARATAALLGALALASVLLVGGTPIAGGRYVQLLLALSGGALVAAAAVLAAALRARGAPGVVWALPLVAGQAHVLGLLWRAAVLAGAATPAALPRLRLVVAAGVLVVTLAMTPGLIALAREARSARELAGAGRETAEE